LTVKKATPDRRPARFDPASVNTAGKRGSANGTGEEDVRGAATGYAGRGYQDAHGLGRAPEPVDCNSNVTKPAHAGPWVNRLLQIERTLTFLDKTTLPCGPMEFTRQVQGDVTLQDQRHDDIRIEAGMVTNQADWSLDIDIDMRFHEWHPPMRLAHEMGVFDRALKFRNKDWPSCPSRNHPPPGRARSRLERKYTGSEQRPGIAAHPAVGRAVHLAREACG